MEKIFNWKDWKHRSTRMPTKEEEETIIRMFQECPWCVIRDILIDSGLTDEKFPIFYYDCLRKNMQASRIGYKNAKDEK